MTGGTRSIWRSRRGLRRERSGAGTLLRTLLSEDRHNRRFSTGVPSFAVAWLEHADFVVGRVRVVGPLRLTLTALAVLHHHASASGFDYVGLFLASVASWSVFPGPGEAALIAAGISAAHQHLSLASAVAVAWAGAMTGATGGWILGMKGGRGLLTAPGPLHHVRLGLIARGDRFYERYGLLAVFLTPSWLAGIHHMRWSRSLPAYAIAALTWALAIGLGAYLLGPPITDIVADAGLAAGLLAGTLFVLAVWLLLRRRSHKSG